MFTYHNRYIPYINVACFVVEGAGIFFSVIMSYMILDWKTGINSIPLQETILRGFSITVTVLFLLYILDFYDLSVSFSLFEVLYKMVIATGILFVIIGIVIYLIPQFGIDQIIYYLTGLFVFLFIVFWRLSLHIFFINYLPLNNILILGDGSIAIEISELVYKSRPFGFNLIGIASKETSHTFKNPFYKFPTWRLEDINHIIEEYKINKIIIAQEELRGYLPVEELLEYKIKGIDIIEWQSFFENLAGKIPIRSLPPSYFIFKEGFSVPSIVKTISRMFDITASSIFLFVFSPIILLFSIIIKFDSEGPVFYFQDRVGQKGEIFKLIKFRTMIKDAENNSGATWASKEDPRITKVGRYLRKYRIDEFPQMVNVLRGEMAIVGPRPERPEFVNILERELPYYSLRNSIKPGITGWAQVNASYSGTIEESRDKLEFDLFYLKNKTFRFDLFICFKTIKTLLLGRGGR